MDAKQIAQKPHIVKSKGRTYCYAWRGGPRLSTVPGHPGFEVERAAAQFPVTVAAGKRKRRLPYAQLVSIEAAVAAAIGNAKQRAKRKSLPFDLTVSAVLKRISDAGGACEVSGVPFAPSYDPGGKYAHNPFGISLDRIEAAKGYTLDNIRVVITAVNLAINQWGIDAFYAIAEEVAYRRKAEDFAARRRRRSKQSPLPASTAS